MRLGLRLGAVLLLATTLSCREREAPRPAADVVVEDAPPPMTDAAVDVPPAALDAPWIEKMELPAHGIAFVTPPVGAREPRPIVVAVHGAVDDPGLMCSAWRLIADVYPFVVCPGGTPIGPPGEGRKYVWASGEHIAQRVHEAVVATKKKYPGRVLEDAPMIYVAFSQGANMAGVFLARNARTFPRAVFTEGGYRTFEDAALARSFAAEGGERVLFTCSQPGCAGSFASSRAAIERAGALARVEYSGPHGHSMPPPVRESIHAVLPWIASGLRGWGGYDRAPKLAGH